MVKIHMDGRKAHIEFEGGPKGVAFDVATAISGIYQGMVNNDLEEADMFRYLMQRSLENGSPVWDADHQMTMIVMPIKKSDAPTDQS